MRFSSFVNSIIRFLLLFVLVSACSGAFSQTLMATQQQATVNKWDVGLDLGLTQFYGDVSSHNFFKKLSDGESRIGVRIYARRMFNPAIGAGISLFSTGLRSIKDRYEGKTVSYNLGGNFDDLSVFAYADFSNLFGNSNSHKLSVYGKLGLGISTWNTALTNNITGEIIHSGATIGSTKYANKAFCVPLGAGLDYRISDRWSVHAGGTFTTVLNDDVDIWRGGSKYDQLLYTNVGVTYFIQSGHHESLQGENQQVSYEQKRRNRRERKIQKNYIPIFDYMVNPAPVTAPQRPKVDVLTPVVKKSQPSKQTVQFRVQIMATPKPLADPSVLQVKYKLGYPVKVVYQNGLYLYSVGHFTTFQDALNSCRVILGKGVHGAFVTAYKNGHRVPLTNKMMRKGFNYHAPDQSSDIIIE